MRTLCSGPERRPQAAGPASWSRPNCVVLSRGVPQMSIHSIQIDQSMQNWQVSGGIGMLLLLAHELFAAQKRCDVRLAVLSGPNLTNVSSLAAPSHRGSCSWAHRSCTRSVRPSLLGWHAANGWPPSWSRSSASAKRLLTRGTHDALVDHAGLRVESAQASERAQRERSCVASCLPRSAKVGE